jgi:hypothetical protein
LHEIKHDGFRVISRKNGAPGNDLTHRFPLIVETWRAPTRAGPSAMPGIIDDADARFLDRHIESRKIGHAALLMLEAADADLVFTISLKRSTLI